MKSSIGGGGGELSFTIYRSFSVIRTFWDQSIGASSSTGTGGLLISVSTFGASSFVWIGAEILVGSGYTTLFPIIWENCCSISSFIGGMIVSFTSSSP